jgi:hypothetical protein
VRGAVDPLVLGGAPAGWGSLDIGTRKTTGQNSQNKKTTNKKTKGQNSQEKVGTV